MGSSRYKGYVQIIILDPSFYPSFFGQGVGGMLEIGCAMCFGVRVCNRKL